MILNYTYLLFSIFIMKSFLPEISETPVIRICIPLIDIFISSIINPLYQFVLGGKFHRHVSGIFPAFPMIFQLSLWIFSYSFLCYHQFSVEKMEKCWWIKSDQLKSCQIFSVFLKSQWNFLHQIQTSPYMQLCHAVYSAQMIVTVSWLLIRRCL